HAWRRLLHRRAPRRSRARPVRGQAPFRGIRSGAAARTTATRRSALTRETRADTMGADTTRKLRSRITTDGIDRAPHRVFMRGMGLDDAAIARPFIGIVTTAGETTPCTGNLAEQAAHAHAGVRAAGGTPRAFTTISVSDGISMNHQGMKCSLVSREV